MSWYRDEYLKSEDWRNLRLAVLAFQGGICESCGKKAVDVHHLVYRKIFDVHSIDLMACCRKCHDFIHEFMAENPDTLKPKSAKRKNGAVGIRSRIAEFVSPRGYVEFNLPPTKSGKIKRVKIRSASEMKDKSKKTLTKVDSCDILSHGTRKSCSRRGAQEP